RQDFTMPSFSRNLDACLAVGEGGAQGLLDGFPVARAVRDTLAALAGTLESTLQRWTTGFETAMSDVDAWQPAWKPVAAQLLSSPPHPMAKQLVANKQLKSLAEMCGDVDRRLAMIRKHPGVFPAEFTSKLETVNRAGMVTISLAYVIFSMKWAFPLLKGPKKLKAPDGDVDDVEAAAEKLRAELQQKGVWAELPACVAASLDAGGQVLEVAPDEAAPAAFGCAPAASSSASGSKGPA
ncbi:unnamed protein product, partial [Prorocentrum cordatum]